jgi:hypothetical protein
MCLKGKRIVVGSRLILIPSQPVISNYLYLGLSVLSVKERKLGPINVLSAKLILGSSLDSTPNTSTNSLRYWSAYKHTTAASTATTAIILLLLLLLYYYYYSHHLALPLPPPTSTNNNHHHHQCKYLCLDKILLLLLLLLPLFLYILVCMGVYKVWWLSQYYCLRTE